MEGRERTGAGPEPTGTELEQLRLFDEYQRRDVAGPQDEAVRDEGRRLHLQGRRYDREHFGVRGDRLGPDCPRHGRTES